MGLHQQWRVPPLTERYMPAETAQRTEGLDLGGLPVSREVHANQAECMWTLQATSMYTAQDDYSRPKLSLHA